jgi:hypothetical protein
MVASTRPKDLALDAFCERVEQMSVSLLYQISTTEGMELAWREMVHAQLIANMSGVRDMILKRSLSVVDTYHARYTDEAQRRAHEERESTRLKKENELLRCELRDMHARTAKTARDRKRHKQTRF